MGVAFMLVKSRHQTLPNQRRQMIKQELK